MKLTNKQSVYLSVLGLGLLALVLDRTVLAPDEAGAGVESDPPVQADPGDRAATDPAVDQAASPIIRTAEAKPSLADQFKDLAESRSLGVERISDAFAPPTTWFQAGPDGGSDFRGHYRLAGVIRGTDQSQAIIEHVNCTNKGHTERFQTMDTGQELDGFTLISIDAEMAVFEKDDVRIELKLKEDSRDERSRASNWTPQSREYRSMSGPAQGCNDYSVQGSANYDLAIK